MLKFFLFAGMILWQSVCGFAEIKDGVGLDDLAKVFDQNPSNPDVTIRLLKELDRQGKSGKEVLDRYFQTQREADYANDYNWVIVRDYVHDINAPQVKYLFANQDKFIQCYSRDDVFQKLDNVLVNFLKSYYGSNPAEYVRNLQKIKENGYEHYDVVYDYFYIKELRADKKADDYFYKARKLFRYFPEDREMIKEITAGALEIMNDISRLKVIQLWAGKTVEARNDFDALYNYALISDKCGFDEVAKKYAGVASFLASKANSQLLKNRATELQKLVH